MTQKMKDFSRMIANQPGGVEIDKFQSYIDDFATWIDNLLRGKEAKIKRSNKQIIIKHIIMLNQLIHQYPGLLTVSAFTSFMSVVLMLISPNNDSEVRMEAWNCAIIAIDSCPKLFDEGNLFPFFAIAFTLSEEAEHSKTPRVFAGNRGSVNAEVLLKQCEVILQMVDNIKTKEQFFYWWKIIGDYVLPRFFDTGKARELKNHRGILSLMFLRSLIKSLKKFRGISVFDLTNGSTSLVRHIVDVLRSTEEIAAGNNEMASEAHDLAVKFIRISFPCHFILSDSSDDNGEPDSLTFIREKIRTTDLPQNLWFSMFFALPASSMTQFLNVMSNKDECSEGAAVFMSLVNICVNLIQPFFAKLRACEHGSDEYWKTMSKLVAHSLRVRVIICEILKTDPNCGVSSGSFLLLNQGHDMFPLLCALAFITLYDRMQIVELTADDYGNLSGVMAVTAKYDGCSGKNSTCINIFGRIGSQLAVVFSQCFLEFVDAEIERNPILYEYKLRNRGSGTDNLFYSFYGLTTLIKWSREKSYDFVNGIFNYVDDKVNHAFISEFTETLLDIADKFNTSKKFFLEELAPRIFKLLFHNKGNWNYNILLRCAFRIMTYAHESGCCEKMARDWWSVLLVHIKMGSKSALIYAVKSYLMQIPYSFALVPVVSFKLGDVVIESLDSDDFTATIQYLVSVAFWKRTEVSRDSIKKIGINDARSTDYEYNVRSFVLQILLMATQMPELRHAEVEAAIVFLLFNDIFSSTEEQTVDKEILVVFKRLFDNMNNQNSTLMARTAILPRYYHLVNKKCPGLFEHIVNSLPKCFLDASNDTFQYMLIFLVGVMSVTHNGSLFNRCMAMLACEIDDRDKQDMLADATTFFLNRYHKNGSQFIDCSDTQSAIVLCKKQDAVWQLGVVDDSTVVLYEVGQYGSSRYKIRCSGQVSRDINMWMTTTPHIGLLFSFYVSTTDDALEMFTRTTDSEITKTYLKKSMNTDLVIAVIGKRTKDFREFYEGLERPKDYKLCPRYEIRSEGDPLPKVAIIFDGANPVAELNIVIRKGINGFYSISQEFKGGKQFGFGRMIVPRPILPFIASWSAILCAFQFRRSGRKRSLTYRLPTGSFYFSAVM